MKRALRWLLQGLAAVQVFPCAKGPFFERMERKLQRLASPAATNWSLSSSTESSTQSTITLTLALPERPLPEIGRCLDPSASLVGSRPYGLDHDESDKDRRGVYVAPAELRWSLFG